METFEVNLNSLQPSQLYICADKVAEVELTMSRRDTMTIDPVPVKRLGLRTVLTDGHTRALVAFRQGRRSVPAYWESDKLDWEAYEICVQWCLQEGIRSIADLQERVVTAERYEQLWYTRCPAMHLQLAAQRKTGQDTTNASG